MKLKKIGSLALAGIMAVSMLTACSGKTDESGEGNGNGDVTPSSTYTSTVMSATDATTQALFKVGSSTQLDGAVRYVAANGSYGTIQDTLTVIEGDDWQELAAKYMGNAVYATGDMEDETKYDSEAGGASIKQLVGSKDVTVYTMFAVSRKYNDEYIDKLVADKVNGIAVALNSSIPDDNNTYDYTINISKADSQKSKNEADKDVDSVIVGIAITLDYTGASFNA